MTEQKKISTPDWSITCWFCQTKEIGYLNDEEVLLHKEISRDHSIISGESVKFQTTSVTIYRCNECYKKDGGDKKLKNKNGCLMGIMISINSVVAYAFANGSFIKFILIFLLLGVVLAVIDRVINGPGSGRYSDKHPHVKKLRRKGWRLGEKPEDV